MKNNITADAAKMYDTHRFGQFGYGRDRDKWVPLFFEFLKRIKPGQTIYDAGCGRGYWLRTYLEAGVRQEHIYAVDLSYRNIKQLTDQGFKAVCGDVMHLPHRDNLTDYVASDGVIHHTADPFRAFSELVRITRPGGRIYLNLYNRWNPYYYIVHRAMLPLRYCYWHITPKIADVMFPVVRLLSMPIALLLFRKPLDNETVRTIFMDQVMTPRAALFSKGTFRTYAQKCGCVVEEFRYNKLFLMLSAVIRVEK